MRFHSIIYVNICKTIHLKMKAKQPRLPIRYDSRGCFNHSTMICVLKSLYKNLLNMIIV